MKKTRVAILFGGRSAEHEVSLQSAKNVIGAIDKEKYEPVLVGIDKQGGWHLCDSTHFLCHGDDPKAIALDPGRQAVVLPPGSGDRGLVTLSDQGGKSVSHRVDVVFPVLHGPFGEDGTVQGLLKLADVPFVGAGVLGSAVGMDKDVMKRLLRDAGIPTPGFLVFHRSRREPADLERVRAELGLPCFVKPANLGSSVGISKVHNDGEFERAMNAAFDYDHKVLVEESIEGREIECSVLGNEEPLASLPGEILPRHEFYSYEAKYLDEDGAALEVPAQLPEGVVAEIQRLAVATFRTLCCEGMARVDFFLRSGTEVLVNEINTIPGFTRISMYPKLWEASGISYTELIDRLIQLAIQRHERDRKLRASYIE